MLTVKTAKRNRDKFKYNRKIRIPLEGYGELVYAWKGNSARNLLEFSVSFRTQIKSIWYTVRRHCWTLHQDKFHTHVRVGFGKRRFRKVYPPPIRGSITNALNWSKHDMINNWYIYLKSFEKLVRNRKDK